MQSISGSITGSHPVPEDRPRLRLLSSIDGGLILSAFLLAAIGLATVHSASSEMPVDYFPRQAGWVAVGLVLMVISMSIDYHVLLDLSVVLYVLAVGGVHHHLVRDLLGAELRTRGPELGPALHRRASAWHERHDRHVGGSDDVNLVLADTDRLDDNHVLPRRVEHECGVRSGGR